MSDNLKNKTEKALIWSFVDKFGQQILYFISGVILANLLMPSDYGKVGLLALFTAMSNILIDSGFGSALIRKREASDADYSTIFYFNILLSVLFYLILFFCAPLLAEFFGIPELTSIARILFIAIIFQAFGIIQQTRMFKYIHFTYLARINIFSLAISSTVAVCMALNGFGVWALVIQPVGMAFIKAVLLWYYGNWRPKFIFRIASIKEFSSYSSNLLGTGLLNTVFNNIYPLLIGKGFSTAAVGFYTQANKFQDIPSALIGNIFRSVAFPVLSSINDDRERLLRVFGKYIRTTAFFIFPIMGLMILVAKPFILALITAKWAESIPMLRILSIAGAFSPLIILYYDIFNTIGRSDVNFRMEIIKKLLLISGIVICLCAGWGIMSLIWLWVIYTLLSLTATCIISDIMVGYKIKNFISDIIPYLLLTLLAMACSSLCYLVFSNNWLLLISILLLFTAIYIGVAAILRLEVWRECYSLLIRKAQKHE
ncbi:MAG: lipopolysaccharide biosynthesis protein [Bacteroidales bacterium]